MEWIVEYKQHLSQEYKVLELKKREKFSKTIL
jgi:hypothetical protein